jgi:glycosyltransferase involved in cell wall biosynthesis
MNEAEWRSRYGVSGGTKLPLVSIILINWNYVSYLQTALDSAAAQDYPALEIITLDNASDDGSADLMEAFSASHPEVRFISLPDNLGQLGAAHHVFTQHQVAGDFICILDADDVLFPNFVSHHVRAHLALGGKLGVSSSEAIQIGTDGAVIASGIPHIRLTMTESWPRIPIAKETADEPPTTAIRVPADVEGWIWSPGTSNVIRRKTIDAFIAAMPRNILPAYCFDTVALPFAHEDAGSLLIEVPLSAYRTHGSNASSSMPRLQHFNPHRPTSSAGSEIQHTWFQSGQRSMPGRAKVRV